MPSGRCRSTRPQSGRSSSSRSHRPDARPPDSSWMPRAGRHTTKAEPPARSVLSSRTPAPGSPPGTSAHSPNWRPLWEQGRSPTGRAAAPRWRTGSSPTTTGTGCGPPLRRCRSAKGASRLGSAPDRRRAEHLGGPHQQRTLRQPSIPRLTDTKARVRLRVVSQQFRFNVATGRLPGFAPVLDAYQQQVAQTLADGPTR